MKHSFSPAMSTVGYLIFKYEKPISDNSAFGTPENLFSRTERICFEVLSLKLTLIFKVLYSMVFFCVPCFLLSLTWCPPALWLQNNKVRRFAFELKMQDKSTYLLASDSEGEMEDWINTLNKILHSSFEIAMQEKRNGDIHDGSYISSTWRNTNIHWSIILH